MCKVNPNRLGLIWLTTTAGEAYSRLMTITYPAAGFSVPFTPGQTLLRREVHALLGGRQQGGIGPSSRTPTVLFFTDRATGHRHGYYDGFDRDGLFQYTGEGQVGDQRMVQGNKAILRHKQDGRLLLGFRAVGSSVTYMGEFELVDHFETDRHDTNGDLRVVVVFRLRPTAGLPSGLSIPSAPITPEGTPTVDQVAIEEQYTERSFVDPSREVRDLERREASLVVRFAESLRRDGHEVGRLKVVPKGETAPLFCDLWDATTSELVEAKATATREQVRMAIGQLMDYGRFIDHKLLTVLLPSRPRTDLVELLRSQGIGVVFPSGGDWERL